MLYHIKKLKFLHHKIMFLLWSAYFVFFVRKFQKLKTETTGYLCVIKSWQVSFPICKHVLLQNIKYKINTTKLINNNSVFIRKAEGNCYCKSARRSEIIHAQYEKCDRIGMQPHVLVCMHVVNTLNTKGIYNTVTRRITA